MLRIYLDIVHSTKICYNAQVDNGYLWGPFLWDPLYCTKLTEIDYAAFWGCAKLRNVVLPEGLTKISSGVFQGCADLVGIDIPDLDFDNHAVLVTRKGGNQVILYYPDEVKEALQEYLQERKQIETADRKDQNALFLSLQKKRISQRAVQLMVKKYCSIAVPLKKRMSPHKLRSTYATRLYHETEDIYLVADALGHSDVNTTRKHYAAMSDQRRRQAAQNVHLPKNKMDE